jgi:hypothetical protein
MYELLLTHKPLFAEILPDRKISESFTVAIEKCIFQN